MAVGRTIFQNEKFGAGSRRARQSLRLFALDGRHQTRRLYGRKRQGPHRPEEGRRRREERAALRKLAVEPALDRTSKGRPTKREGRELRRLRGY